MYETYYRDIKLKFKNGIYYTSINFKIVIACSKAMNDFKDTKAHCQNNFKRILKIEPWLAIIESAHFINNFINLLKFNNMNTFLSITIC